MFPFLPFVPGLDRLIQHQMRHIIGAEHLLTPLGDQPPQQHAQGAEEELAARRVHLGLTTDHVPCSQVCGNFNSSELFPTGRLVVVGRRFGAPHGVLPQLFAALLRHAACHAERREAAGLGDDLVVAKATKAEVRRKKTTGGMRRLKELF